MDSFGMLLHPASNEVKTFNLFWKVLEHLFMDFRNLVEAWIKHFPNFHHTFTSIQIFVIPQLS